MRKLFGFILILCLFTPLPAKADEENKWRLEGEFSIEYYSRYVGCVNGITIFSRSVLQQSLTLKLMPLGLYITGWGSINVDRLPASANAKAGKADCLWPEAEDPVMPSK